MKESPLMIKESILMIGLLIIIAMIAAGIDCCVHSKKSKEAVSRVTRKGKALINKEERKKQNQKANQVYLNDYVKSMDDSIADKLKKLEQSLTKEELASFEVEDRNKFPYILTPEERDCYTRADIYSEPKPGTMEPEIPYLTFEEFKAEMEKNQQ